MDLERVLDLVKNYKENKTQVDNIMDLAERIRRSAENMVWALKNEGADMDVIRTRWLELISAIDALEKLE